MNNTDVSVEVDLFDVIEIILFNNPCKTLLFINPPNTLKLIINLNTCL